MKNRIMEMYRDAVLRLAEAGEAAEETETGSQERDHFERVYGERHAYGRILKELYGVKGSELQRILDEIHRR